MTWEDIVLVADRPLQEALRGVESQKLAKALLKADKEAGRILIDSETTLAGIPPEAWDYKLGNRCALEWVLDQYKEKKPKDLILGLQLYLFLKEAPNQSDTTSFFRK